MPGCDHYDFWPPMCQALEFYNRWNEWALEADYFARGINRFSSIIPKNHFHK